MTPGGLPRPHDRALLDALEAIPAEAFQAEVWRVAPNGRDALRGSIAGGRWSLPGGFEVLYTSLTAAGALAEIGYRLSLEPVWPSRIEHLLHRLAVRTAQTLRLADLARLAALGMDVARYAGFDYAATQEIAAAAFFLEFDGLIVPSARSPHLNLVVFTERPEVAARLTVAATAPVDWARWRAARPARPHG